MRTFVNLDTSITVEPKVSKAINAIGNTVLQPFAKDDRFKKSSKSRLILSASPNGNQVDLIKVDNKTDINDAINVFMWLNAETIKTARDGKPNSNAKDSAKDANADIAVSIGIGWLELAYRANGLKAYNTKGGGKKMTSEFITDIKKLGCGVSNRKAYAMQGIKELSKAMLADIETVKALKVAEYKKPTDSKSNKSRLYCVVGCDFNELITQQFKLDDIPNIQKILSCKIHKGTPQTEPRQSKDQTDAVKTVVEILN
jgi:hypothetical protein